MTAAQIRKSIKSGRLVLTGWPWFTHFQIVFSLILFSAIGPTIALYDALLNARITFPSRSAVTAILLLAAAIVFFFIRQAALRMIPVRTSLTKEQTIDLVTTFARQSGWQTLNKTTTFLRYSSMVGFWQTTGEQITIVFDKDVVFVNSIRDPNRRRIVSVPGHNRSNVRDLVELLSAN